jgi:WD40 repeat protein
LDLADPIQPEHVLKGHKAPVTSLTIHSTRKNILISGSADETVNVWDLTSMSLVDSISISNGEVQNLKWSPSHESTFICQSGKNVVQLFDLKTSSEPISSVNLNCQPIDALEYNSFDQNQLFISSEDGSIHVFDTRMLSNKPLYSVKAHNKSIPGLSSAGEYLVSNSLDGRLRIWNLKGENQIKLVKEKQTPLKQLFVSSIHPENPYLFACGAEGAEVVCWDFYEEVVKGTETENPKITKSNKNQLEEEGEEEEQLDSNALDME